MITPQLVMITSQRVNLTLPLIVGGQQTLESVSQLLVETVASVECGCKVGIHPVCLI